MTENARLLAIEAQQRWEIEGVERGVERYRRAVLEADLPDTTPGQKLLMTVLRDLISAISAVQTEAHNALRDKKQGRCAPWWIPMLSLDDDKMAVITARTALSIEATSKRTVTAVALAISNHVLLERQFEMWKDEQRVVEQGGKPNIYKIMQRRVKVFDDRVVRKLLKAEPLGEPLAWTKDVRVQFGRKLIELLVKHGGGFFEAVLVAQTRRVRTTEYVLKLTDKAKEFIAQGHSASELTRPWLLPMICPPAEWRTE